MIVKNMHLNLKCNLIVATKLAEKYFAWQRKLEKKIEKNSRKYPVPSENTELNQHSSEYRPSTGRCECSSA